MGRARREREAESNVNDIRGSTSKGPALSSWLHMAAKWWHVTAPLSRDIATRSRD